MALIINGVTIPENLDSIYANNIDLDTIVANGVIVWKKQKSYYAYQNGAPNTAMGIGAPFFCETNKREGHYNEDPVIQSLFNAIGFVISVGCSASDDGPITGMCTNWIPTNGLSNLHTEIYHHIYRDERGIGTPTYKIIGLNAAGNENKLWEGQWNYHDKGGALDLQISDYTHIKVVLTYSTGGGTSGLNKKIFFGIREIRIL